MKKLVILSIATLMFAACGGESESKDSSKESAASKKGSWTADDKGKFTEKCKAQMSEIMGENTDKLCGCLTSKLETSYSNFDEADKAMNNADGAKIADECATEVMKDVMKDMKPSEDESVNTDDQIIDEE